MKCNCYKLILCLLISISFISFGLCGEKRDRDDAESSTARENKLARYQTDSASPLQASSELRIEDATAYKKSSLLNLVEWIDKFELECKPRTLEFNEEIPKTKITEYLKSCDEQAKQWLDEKVERLGGIGKIIERWYNGIAFLIPRYLDLIMVENVRSADKFVFKLRRSLRRERLDLSGMESTENSRRAYFLGDGICVHMLASPFNKIVEFMKVILRDFGNLEYVKDFRNLTKLAPAGITIYVFQKICHSFRRIPKISKRRPLIGVSVAAKCSRDNAKEGFEKALREIKAIRKDRGYNCEWSTLFYHKLLYHFLGLLREESEIKELKKIADDATDALVWHCLSALGSTEEEFKIYDTIRGKSDEHLFPALLELLRETFESYLLQPDQSINDALDIREPNNGFRKSLMTEVTRLIFDSDTNERLADYFIDLLLGHLDAFQKTIFKRSNYKREIVEFELPEFLFHVFSIKGYRPKFSSPLLDVYYLQTIAEICNMIPIDISKIISSRLAHKKHISDLSNASNSYRRVRVFTQKTDQLALEKISTFDTVCNLEGLHELSNFNNEAADSFLNKCDFQVRKWFEKKTRKIDTFGLIIERWMRSIDHYIEEIYDNIESMSKHDIGGDIRLVRKLKCSLTYKTLGNKKIIDNETFQSTRLALNYGDGICVHILSPPFDRVENFMDVVMSRFKHLNYFNDLKTTGQVTNSLEIYIFQKFCRYRYTEPIQMRSHRVIHTNYYIDIVNAARINFRLIVKSVQLENIEKKNRFSCDSIELFNFKQGYRVLRLLSSNTNFREFKQVLDELLNERVKTCLSKFDNEGVGRVFAKTMSTSTQAMLPTLSETLSNAIESYQLPPDQSINSALDIRSSNNAFKQVLMTQIKDGIMQGSNIDVVKLFTNLLGGHFDGEIFSDKIYENKQLVEYKLIEFLFQVFDIEGYKPQVSSPLLAVYYLYKISEICDMIPVDGLSLN